jgi:hypothetical protein
MNLPDFITSRPDLELIQVNGRNRDFALDTHQVHLSGQSFGDSLRMGTVIKHRIEPGKEQVVFVEHDAPFGVEVMKNLRFVDWIVKFPRSSWRLEGRDLDFIDGPKFKNLPIDYERFIEGYLGVSPDGIALRYELEDFAWQTELIPGYVIMQSSTSWHKQLSIRNPWEILKRINQGHAVSSVQDDGQPLEQSIWWAANADAAVGVESWCASLLPMLGKPSVMLCLPSSLQIYGDRWRKAWPTIRLVDINDQPAIDHAIEAMLDSLEPVAT